MVKNTASAGQVDIGGERPAAITAAAERLNRATPNRLRPGRQKSAAIISRLTRFVLRRWRQPKSIRFARGLIVARQLLEWQALKSRTRAGALASLDLWKHVLRRRRTLVGHA